MLRIRFFKKGGIMKKLRVVFVTLFLKKITVKHGQIHKNKATDMWRLQ